MNKPAKWVAVGGLFIISSISTNIYAQSSTSHPNMEFLEFLGDWEADDGQWIDPIELLESSTEKTEQDNESSMELYEESRDVGREENMDEPFFPAKKGSQHE